MNALSLEHTLTAQDKVFFLHIPKTAGTTFGTLLDDHFAQQERWPFYFMTELPTTTLDTLRQYRYIRGHFYYEAICKLLPKQPVCLTMLRDPVERFISNFAHLQRPDAFPPVSPKIREMSLADFVSDSTSILNKVFANHQTRLLAQRLNFTTWEELTEIIQRQTLYRYDSIDLELAQERLNNLAFVGLTERMQASLFLLAFTFGWRPVVDFQTLNVAPSRPRRDQISEATLQKIKEWNTLDQALYRYTEQLFEARFAQMTQTLLERYGTRTQASLPYPLPEETLCALLEKHYERRAVKRYQSRQPSLQFQFDQALEGANWHSPETSPEHGVTRWSGPGTLSTLDLPLAQQRDLLIKFRILTAPAPDILESLRLTVNNHPIPLTHNPDWDSGIIFQGRIPRATLQQRPNFTRLSFEVNRTLSPQTLNPHSPDKRQLGVLFNWIELYPAEESLSIARRWKNSRLASGLDRLRRLGARLVRLLKK